LPSHSTDFKVEISLKFSTEEIEQKKHQARKPPNGRKVKTACRCLAQKRGPMILSKMVDSAGGAARFRLFLAVLSSFLML
tara:strand:- start:1570 stop:1809 length:240 start_codon:yes stop_codon:yes gene_type:complete